MMDMELPEIVAVCPSCGSEFQPHVTHCLDCGTQTRSSYAAPELPRTRRQEAPAVSPLPLPPDTPAAMVRASSADWVKKLEGVLAKNGIPCRLDIYDPKERPARTYAAWVAEADLDRATELEHELLRAEIPDYDETFPELPPADVCPACGSAVSSDDAECPSCGLALNGPNLS
jgi:ribosomal protein L32